MCKLWKRGSRTEADADVGSPGVEDAVGEDEEVQAMEVTTLITGKGTPVRSQLSTISRPRAT